VNELIGLLGIESWKPVFAALLLPPLPLLLLVLVGARLMLARRGLGWLLILIGTIALWLSTCAGFGTWLTRVLVAPPPALTPAQIAQLRAEVKAHQPLTIVVLGGGREPLAPEYGSASLKARSLERLRYGLWLGRETGAPVGFSGGVGWSEAGALSEAEVAERIAKQDFGVTLAWIEPQSRDTRENAMRTVALLERAGVKRALLVTHGWHMTRALAHFRADASGRIEVIAAPMGLARSSLGPALDWMPSTEGYARVNQALREGLARLVGA